MNIKNELCIEIRPEFQRKLFSLLLKKHGRHALSKQLKKSLPILYHYKNLRVKSLKEETFKEVCRLANISEEEQKENTLRTFFSEDEIQKNLDIGREYTKAQLSTWKKEIPPIEELFDNKYVIIEDWLEKCIRLMNRGARKIEIITKENGYAALTYQNYAKGKKQRFTNYLPLKIRIDEDFQYFLGLWCGDRVGKGRFGVVNKNKALNFYTAYYLKKLYQNPTFMLFYHESVSPPVLDYPMDSVYVSKAKKGHKGYCVWVSVVNGTLFRFFDYLDKNIDYVLKRIPDKYIFFAGLFDAEGNVSLEGGCFRWSCLNAEKVEIYKKHLSELELFKRYDGCNLVTYNKDGFMSKIFPYLKHPEKRNRAELISRNQGTLEPRLIALVKLVKDNEGITLKQSAKALKKGKLYALYKLLKNLGYINYKGYPIQMYTTNKGLDLFQEGGLQ